MTPVIYHNPDCGTSRNVLAVIEAAGSQPVVVEYLSVGWTRELLLTLLTAAGLTPREALRETKSPAKELGLLDDGVSDEAVGVLQAGDGLLQVDDVDAVAVGEDVRAHLRVPALGLVAEVDACFEQSLHRDHAGVGVGHG